MLPGDLVSLTHPVPAWNGKQLKVIKKKEKEDRSTTEGREIGEGYKFFLRVEPGTIYSDTDFAPIVTRPVVDGLSQYSTPPAATLTLVQSPIVENDLTTSKSVLGTLHFGAFGLGQFARVKWTKPDLTTEDLKEVRPDDDNKGTFRESKLATGLHKFHVKIFSDIGIPQEGDGIEEEITITASTFFVGEFNVPVGVGRSINSTGADNRYKGNDTAAVPLSRIVAEVIKGVVVDNGRNVDCNVAGRVVGAKIEQAAQGDSIFESYVEVYNKFHELVKAFMADGFTGAGTLGKGTYLRENADAFEEAFFKIIIRNAKGFSLPKYLYNGATLADAPPVKKFRIDCPVNVVGTPLSSSSISFSGTFNFSGKSLKLQKREVGQRFADWVDHVTGIAAFPFVATGFPSDKELEFRFVSSAGINNSSNIMRVKTFQVGQVAPARPTPQGLSVVPNPSSPTSSLKVNASKNASDNTGIDYEINGVVSSFGANYEEHFMYGLGENVSRTVRVRNTWNTGVPYSEWTDYVTGTTQVTPSSSTPPQNFQGVFDNPNDEADFTFEPGTGAGAYTLEISDDGSTGWANTNLAIGAGANGFSYPLAQSTNGAYSKYFRLKRNDVAGYAPQIVQIFVPQADTGGAMPPSIESVSYSIENQQVVLQATPQGGSGNYTIERSSTGEEGTWTELSNNHPSFPFQDNIAQNGNIQNRYYRVKRNDVAGYSNPGFVSIPALTGGNFAPTPVSLSYNTLSSRFQLTWTPNGGSGSYVIEAKRTTEGDGLWGTEVSSLATSGATSRNIPYTNETGFFEEWEFRIRRVDVGDANNWAYYPGSVSVGG